MSAIFGGSLMGIVGKFSPKYITAMSGGQALGGIFTALTEVCSLWIGASPVLSGLVYFIIGDTVLLLSLIAYILLERAVSQFRSNLGINLLLYCVFFNPISDYYTQNNEIINTYCFVMMHMAQVFYKCMISYLG